MKLEKGISFQIWQKSGYRCENFRPQLAPEKPRIGSRSILLSHHGFQGAFAVKLRRCTWFGGYLLVSRFSRGPSTQKPPRSASDRVPTGPGPLRRPKAPREWYAWFIQKCYRHSNQLGVLPLWNHQSVIIWGVSSMVICTIKVKCRWCWGNWSTHSCKRFFQKAPCIFRCFFERIFNRHE